VSSPFAAPTPDAVPITFVAKETWGAIRAALAAPAAAFAESAGFDA